MDENFGQSDLLKKELPPAALESNEMNRFYQEVVSPPPKKNRSRLLMVVLAAGILLGTALGYGVNHFSMAQITGTEIAYATNQNGGGQSAGDQYGVTGDRHR